MGERGCASGTQREGTSMGRAGRDDKNLADLDELIGRITADACGDDEKLWAFRQAFEDRSRYRRTGSSSASQSQ